MQYVKYLLALFLFALSTSGLANQVTNLGTIAPPSTLTIGNTFASASNTMFYDNFLFTIPEGFISSVSSSISLGNMFGISDLQARLYQGHQHITGPAGNALIQGWSNTINVSPGVNLSTTVINPNTLLQAGDYTLQIRGLVFGTAGGAYSGVLNVAPIPEPDSYALLICGLGIMGMCARRKLLSS